MNLIHANYFLMIRSASSGYFVCILLGLLSVKCLGQNYGLSKPQDAATLPVSRSAFQPSSPDTHHAPVTRLMPGNDGAYLIRGGWELAEAGKTKTTGDVLSTAKYNRGKWYNAVVPGTVLTTLVKQGVYPDPYWGLNNLHIPDSLCREDWWYRTRFQIPAGKKGKQVWLSFAGINYEAQIWLNGHELGKIKGAFQSADYNITPYLNTAGGNTLAVHIIPPPHPGIPHEESALAGTGPNGGLLCLDGPTFISSEGWDWVPGIRDRNIGIWQDVSLRFTDAVVISNPQVITDLPLPDTTSARITVKADLENRSAKPMQVTLKGEIGTIRFEQAVGLKPYESRLISFTPDNYKQLLMQSPKLWWPNGYGSPNLYHLKLSAIMGAGEMSDSKTVSFGIRELSYELTVDAPDDHQKRVEFNPTSALRSGKPVFDNEVRSNTPSGVMIPKVKNGVDPAVLQACADTGTAPYLVIKVNGKRIYCKGGNWGMDDAMKNVSREHLEPYFKLHRDAHFNMIRNWTGESTEEVFYQLCDEYGILVWNDFWLSTEGFNLNVKDNDLFMANARAVVKRFRNHPSIAVWCPRNEGYAPADLESRLSALIAEADGTRYYQPNSRYMNLRTSGPWHYHRNPAEYHKFSNGFSTELGTPSIPTAASMRKMMAKEDLWPIGDVWYYHDFHDGQKAFVADMDSLYGRATNLDDFCRKAQLLNYNSHRAMFEAWTSKLWNNTSGLLLWMTHPAWPSTVWQTYSWDYETFGSYFASMKACEPVHIQIEPNGHVDVVNTSLKAYQKAVAQLQVYNLKGTVEYQQKTDLNINANQLTSAFIAGITTQLDGVYLIRLTLTDSNGNFLSVNDYWKNYGKATNFDALNSVGKATVKVSAEKHGSKNTYIISNPSSVPAIALKLNLINASGQIILPAYFSDGYFNLLPGESKTVSVTFESKDTPKLSISGYNEIEVN